MIVIDEKLMNRLAEEARKSPKPTKDIYLAGGCFWGTEHYFKQIEGVAITNEQIIGTPAGSGRVNRNTLLSLSKI